MIGMGFINTWSTMAGMRVLLGILEVGSLLVAHGGEALISLGRFFP